MIGDLLRLNVNQKLGGANVQNVLYYSVAQDDTVISNVEALSLQWLAVVKENWLEAVSQLVLLDCIEVQKVFPDPVERSIQRDINENGRKVGSEALPGTTTALFQKSNPAVSGVGKSGRMYLAGLEELDQNNGRIVSASIALLQLLVDSLAATLLSTDNGNYESAWAIKGPLSPFPITGFVTAPDWKLMPRLATQRRRRTPVTSFS